MTLERLADLGAVQRTRGPLVRARRALEAGRLTVGFIGGSITDPRPVHNWPEDIMAWLVDRFPAARIVVENAAIGATGSDLGVFRVERDLIQPGCDLVFIEFAVNDVGAPTDRRNRSREGLIRKLLAGGGRDVVLAYTFGQALYDDMINGRVPATIAEFEALAEHYAIPSVWMGLHALREVARGLMSMEEWLPDGVHPEHRGSLSYAQSVFPLLEAELGGPAGAARKRKPPRLPPPLHPQNWENAHILPLDTARTEGPWAILRWTHCPWIDQVLHTSTPGARATIPFEGRGLCLGFDFGKLSADFRWRLDGGEWKRAGLERYDWMPPRGWFRPFVVADDLPRGKHEFELEVLHPGEGRLGSDFDVAMIGGL